MTSRLSGLAGDPDRPLRLLLVGHGFPTRGGIPTFVTGLVTDPWLRQRVIINFLNTAPRAQKRPGALDRQNIRLTVTHVVQIFKNARQADLVHLNLAMTPFLPLLRAVVLTISARLTGAPVLVHAHTGTVERYVRASTYRLLLRVQLKMASAMIVVTRAAEETAGRLGPVVRLVNGVDIDRFPPRPPAEVEPGADPQVVFVGTIAERKGLIDFADALLALKKDCGRLPARPVIVGDGVQEGPGAFDRMKEAYARRGLDEVEFVGTLDPKEVVQLLSRAAVFCLPSHSEGLPLSLLEAMAAGTATVATPVGDIPEVLDQGRVGVLVPVRDPGALATALRHLLADPSRRRDLGKRARERVELRFSHRDMVRQLWKIYQDHALIR
jgi:glycosyltransferase involved in cell wall biosynthesis